MITLQILLQYSTSREPNPAAWLAQGLLVALIIYLISKRKSKKAVQQYNDGASSTTIAAFNGVPTYKEDVPTAIKRLYEWKSDIPAIIIVATDFIYKGETEKAFSILVDGDNYNDRVFAVKCLLGHCCYLKYEKEIAYACGKSVVELLNNGKVSVSDGLNFYKIIGRLLPEAIYNLAVVSHSQNDIETYTTLYKLACGLDNNYKNKAL